MTFKSFGLLNPVLNSLEKDRLRTANKAQDSVHSRLSRQAYADLSNLYNACQLLLMDQALTESIEARQRESKAEFPKAP